MLPYLETIENLHYIDTTQTTHMSFMFNWTSNLTTLDLSTWNTSNVTTMAHMFYNTRNLNYLNVSTWDTHNVTTMSSMFVATNLTTLNISEWDTSKVENMLSMFRSMRELTYLDISNWNTSNVTNMRSMFSGTRNLTNLDASNWDVSSVSEMSRMFDSTGITTLDLSNWNISNVESMMGMFSRTRSLNTLTLGPNFHFLTHDSEILSEIDWNEGRTNYGRPGHWQNIGTGTPEAPNGKHILTSAELVEQFNGQTMSDTFVWQPHQPTPPEIQEQPPIPTHHIVQSGDTLSELAQQYRTTVAEFVRLNNIENPDFIQAGQILNIPPPS